MSLLLLTGSTFVAAAPTDDLAGRADAGKAAMAAGRFDEAAGIYADLVRALPNEPGMRLNLGLAHGMAGRPAEAVRHLEAALKLKPDLVPAALFLGTAHMQLGQPARAVAPLEKVVAAQPANLQARQMLADALATLERWEPASRHFKQLAEAAPDRAAHWYGLGRSYEGLAVAAFQRLARANPESPWVLLLTAEALASEGRHANAHRLYREALVKGTSLPEVHEALALIYDKTGHPEWAAAERDRARLAPASDCRVRTAECDFRAGRYDAVLSPARGRSWEEGDYWAARAAGELARAAFLRLDQLGASPEAALVRADVQAARGGHREAALELRRAAEAWPDDARIRRQLGRELHRARDFTAARSVLEDLLKAEPGSPELVFLLGDTLLQQEEPLAAIRVLEPLVAADPKATRTRAVLGRAYALAGEPARAIPHLVAAAATDEDGSLHYQLSRAYQAAGQAEAAAGAVQKSRELRDAAEARQRQSEQEFKITPPPS